MKELEETIGAIIKKHRISDWGNVLRDDIIEAVKEWMKKEKT